jgi:CCR4-NOT transcription complex subunit 1
MYEKSKKLKEVLEEQYYPYFSRYLVVKRVSTEANFQKLYAEFLDHVRVSKLEKQLVETTYEYIKVLLNSDKVLTSSSERSLLKNLGSWLGLLTIAKNKAVRANRLHIKGLILQAYEAGRLIAVIPFVAKILEACSKSKVFKPPNPWLMALVGVLKEIFELPDLKLNLKFEIEVLFNNLSINMKDVTTYGLLKDRAPKTGAAFNSFSAQAGLGKSTAPFANDASGLNSNPSLRAPQSAATSRTTPGYPTQGGAEPPAITGADASVGADGQFAGGDQATIIPNLPAYVNISPTIALFSMYPHLKRLVPTAIDRAIREIITPVVERSVTIACVTTRELVMKDFAMEPDENKMRKAAHQMVQKLTSSLAEVTCKEPLRVSINNHLGSLLEANAQSAERSLVEHACTQISTDNLELGIKLIDKAASDRAVREIEEALGPMFSVRHKHREQTGQPYYDMSIFVGNSRFPNSLPDPLRPKPGGLSATQLCVYDDFSSIPTHQQMQVAPQTKADPKVEQNDSNAMAPPSSGQPSAQRTPALSGANTPDATTPTPGSRSGLAASGAPAVPGAPLTSQQTLDKLIGCLASLEQAVARFPNYKNTPLSSLPSVGARGDHEIHVLLRMIPTILNQCPLDEATFPRDVVAFTFAHKAFKRLYERDNRHSLLQIDVHIQVLKCIRGICPKIVKELTSWLLFSDDERKYLIQITTGLLRARMLHIPDVDMYLAKLVHGVHASGQALQTRNNLSQNLHPHLEFVISLVSRTVVKEPVLAVQELPHLFDALSKMLSVTQRRNKPVAEVLGHLLQEVRAAAPPPAGGAESEVPAALPPTPVEQPTAPQAAAQIQPPTPPLQTPPQELSMEPRSDVGKVVDEATAALLAEEAIMDREAWDDEPASFRQQVVFLLDDWMNICLQGTASDQMIAQYLSVLQQQRVLATPESTSRFFLIITKLCVDSAFSAADKAVAGAAPSQPVQLSYTAIDALAKLVVFLVKFFAGGEAAANAGNPNAPKVRMLSAFLRAACRVLRRDADTSGRGVRSGKGPGNFNQRPYFRLLANLLHHLNTPDPSLDSNNVDVLMAFGHCFRLLRPSRVPSFCFAWLELIAHRMFMSKLLICKSHQCTVLFEHLLVDLLEFMQPYLRNANLTDSVRMLYKGTLRVLLVLLHDFPEFLCEFHFSFCNVIPPTCIQMRNLILSAFPRSMRLPDPFTPNLKVDMLPDIAQPPRILSDLTAQLSHHRQTLLAPLDSYLAKRAPPTFPGQIRHQLLLTRAQQVKEAGTKYNVPLINSLVLYVGCQGIAKLQVRPHTTTLHLCERQIQRRSFNTTTFALARYPLPPSAPQHSRIRSPQSKSGMVSQFQDNACMDIFEVLFSCLSLPLSLASCLLSLVSSLVSCLA